MTAEVMDKLVTFELDRAVRAAHVGVFDRELHKGSSWVRWQFCTKHAKVSVLNGEIEVLSGRMCKPSDPDALAAFFKCERWDGLKWLNRSLFRIDAPGSIEAATDAILAAERDGD